MNWLILGWLTGLVFLCIASARWVLSILKLADNARLDAFEMKREARENRRITAEVLQSARKAYEPLSIGGPDGATTDDTICSVCDHKLGFHGKRRCWYVACNCQVSVERVTKEIQS